MGAALVGGTLASLGIGEAAADEMCKPTGKKCNKNSQCCSDNCSRSGTSRFGTCAAACVPDFGEAGCLADTECCSGACVHEFGPTERGTCFPCHCPNETSLCRLGLGRMAPARSVSTTPASLHLCLSLY
jgi:hypothetical protein